MQKKRSAAYMTPGEKIAGTVFFVMYLAVLPAAAPHLFRLLALLLGGPLPDAVKNAVYYYALVAVTMVIFHNFLVRTSGLLLDNLSGAASALAMGLVALYGLNELVYRLSRLIIGGHTNLNDMAVSAQIAGAPHMTALIVIVLAPFVEETLFRGLVFGCIKERSRGLAYLVSCLLFALLHVWQFAVVNRDVTYFLLMVQYLVPGLVLAWAYETSGTLWTAVGLHAAANALALWGMA